MHINWELDEVRFLMDLMTELDLEGKLETQLARKVMSKLASYLPMGEMLPWQDSFLADLTKLPWGQRLASIN